jgi:futalosine hydrolase
MTILVIHAADAEGDLLEAGCARLRASRAAPQVLRTGVGKATSASALTAALVGARAPRLVLVVGVCGAYPARVRGRDGAPLAVGELCLIADDRLADEGVEDETGFRGLAELGLGMEGPFAADAAATARAAAALGGARAVRGATVSTCSGRDDLARAVASRTGADVETMEGAAVALVCARFGVPWVQLRCVSNFAGDRAAAAWDLRGAARAAQEAALRLLGGGWP